MLKKTVFVLIFMIAFVTGSRSQDWPIFKGNIYFTGNNDEIIVPNGNLKWLYQADERVFNPVVSDGRIYFVDIKANLYCLDEDSGELYWKFNVREVSDQFKTLSKSAGKVKYPLIKGNVLFLTDPVAIYAFNKFTGKVLWARTAMKPSPAPASGKFSSSPGVIIDGIYSDPIISGETIFYGTREKFNARGILNGEQKWESGEIKTYSGFPTFYDELLFTQSMDYKTGIYSLFCVKASTGEKIWSKDIEKPFVILPPVVYGGKVMIPSGTKLYSLDVKTGNTVWVKDYGKIITSSPSFTDRAVIFVTDNSDLSVVDPANGDIIYQENVKEKAGPQYVTIRDQIYIAYNGEGGTDKAYGHVKAVNFADKAGLWKFEAPFPGAVSQPVASRGILFMPAGNYVYAIGAKAYPKVVKGGSSVFGKPDKDDGKKTAPDKKDDGIAKVVPSAPVTPPAPEMKMKKIKIEVSGNDGKGLPATVDVTKTEDGKIVYSKKEAVNKSGELDVPDGDGVDVLASSDGYVPKKEHISKDDKEKKIVLDKIETGKSFVVENINFELNKAYLKAESINILNGIIDIMKSHPELKLEVRGYTDSSGDAKYNQKLSEKRADAVVEYMVKNGISPERLKGVGFGEKNPIASNDTEEGRAKNRRTEFYFTK